MELSCVKWRSHIKKAGIPLRQIFRPTVILYPTTLPIGNESEKKNMKWKTVSFVYSKPQLKKKKKNAKPFRTATKSTEVAPNDHNNTIYGH